MTGDLNPIHLRKSSAKRAGFSGVVLPGMLTVSLALGILQQSRIFSGPVLLEAHCRFIKPVYRDSKIVYTFRFDEVRVGKKDPLKTVVRLGFLVRKKEDLLAEGYLVLRVNSQ